MMGSLFWSFWRGQLKWYIKMMIIWFQKYGSDRAHLATNQRLACRTVQRAPSPWGRLEVHTAIMVQGADPQGMRKSFNIRWRDIYMFQNVFTFTYDLCLYLQCVVTDQVSRSTECEFSWFIFMNLMVAHCFNSAQKNDVSWFDSFGFHSPAQSSHLSSKNIYNMYISIYHITTTNAKLVTAAAMLIVAKDAMKSPNAGGVIPCMQWVHRTRYIFVSCREWRNKTFTTVVVAHQVRYNKLRGALQCLFHSHASDVCHWNPHTYGLAFDHTFAVHFCSYILLHRRFVGAKLNRC